MAAGVDLVETFRPTLFVAAAGGIAGIVLARILHVEGLLENLVLFLIGMAAAFLGYEVLAGKKKPDI